MAFVQPASATQALRAIEALTRGEVTPYRRVLEGVAKNTRLVSGETKVAAAQVATGLFDRVRKRFSKIEASTVQVARGLARTTKSEHLDAENVEHAFADFVSFGVAPVGAAQDSAAVPFSSYHDQLIGLRNALQSYLENPDDPEPVLKQASTARNQTEALIAERPVGSGAIPRLQALMLEPIKAVSGSAARGMRAQVGAAWCASVAQPFAYMAHRYPFDPAGADAPLMDVLDYFNPESGILWGYYQTALARDVVRLGDHFRFDDRNNRAAHRAYAPSLLPYLRAAQQVSRALFGAQGAKTADITFDVRLLPSREARSISLEIDGQVMGGKADQSDFATWHTARWPGDGKSQGATLGVTNDQGLHETLQREGEWGLFRLLEAGTISGDPTSERFMVHWKFASLATEVAAEVRLHRRETPFFGVRAIHGNRLLQPFRQAAISPPLAIAHDGPRCEISTK